MPVSPRQLTLLLFACLLLTGLPARGATGIPFEYRGGLIVLNVAVAGQEAPLRFALDSGAGATVLHLPTAERLGLKFGRAESVQGVQGRCAARRVEGFSASVGGVPIARSLLALDLGRVSQASGCRLDGLLGLDFLRGRAVQIDYAAGRLTLLERAAGGTQVPLALRNGALCVEVGVNGTAPAWMRLDTGCTSALEWAPGQRSFARSGSPSIAAVAGLPHSALAEVALGPEHVAGVKAGLHAQPLFPGEAGLVGNGLLSRFRVTIDLAHHTLALAR